MGWLKIDDGFLDHPKVIGLTDRQLRHHLAAMLYAARYRTDGHLPASALKALRIPQKHQDLLVDNGLWDRDPDTKTLSIHDFSIYNSATIEAKVAAFLDSNPDATANEVHRVVGGRKTAVLALVQEIRGSLPGSPEPPGNQTGTGSRSVPRARDARAGGPAPPAAEQEQELQALRPSVSAAAEPEAPRTAAITAAATRYAADINVLEPEARALPAELFDDVVERVAQRCTTGHVANPAGLLIKLVRRARQEADRRHQLETTDGPRTPLDDALFDARSYARGQHPWAVAHDLLARKLARHHITDDDQIQILEQAADAYQDELNPVKVPT